MTSSQVLVGDCCEVLRTLPERSVQCVVTSPPYYGLRDYGTAEWEGGDPDCQHRETELRRGVNLAQSAASTRGGAKKIAKTGWIPFRDVCGHCGARRVDQQVGLEATPDEYVARLVDVFREVRRVLRDDGTVWLNLGDSYARNPAKGGSGPNGKHDYMPQYGNARRLLSETKGSSDGAVGRADRAPVRVGGDGLKEKDLIGIPWLAAFALRADGWFLRSDVIWSKLNPMPESVTDRPTSAHEHLFLFAKQARYYYDADAIRERATMGKDLGLLRGRVGDSDDGDRVAWHAPSIRRRQEDGVDSRTAGSGRRNKRNVWEIASAPFPDAHFATYPPALVEPCVLAGSAPRACGVCGAAWIRVLSERHYPAELANAPKAHGGVGNNLGGSRHQAWLDANPRMTEGWKPTCGHADGDGRSVVLDPFCGSGTTGVVAAWHGRDFVGIDLNPEYAAMARRRIETEGRLGRAAHRPQPRQDEALFDA